MIFQETNVMGPWTWTCLRPDCLPLPTLLQLAVRSLCSSNRCLSARVDSHEVLCQSPMEPGGTVSTIPTGSSDVNSPRLEDATMVPNASELVDWPSLANHTESEETNQQGSHASSPSELAIWHVSGSQNLSEETTALIFQSWRAKTNKSYDSLFANGIVGVEQSFNPFLGPITNVANFLAQLCAEGYQYGSINSYRSAISSVHEKVDEHDVGQSPPISKASSMIGLPYLALGKFKLCWIIWKAWERINPSP